MSTPTAPRRILIVRFGAMGDLVLTTPVIRALRRQWPQAEISYIVGRGLADTLRGHPDLAEVIEFDKREDARPARLLAFLKRIRARRYDLFVNLQRSVKTVLIGAASGAPLKVTYRRDGRVQPGSGQRLHAVENFLRTLAPLGITAEAQAAVGRHLDFVWPQAALSAVESLLDGHGLGAGRPLVLVNPGASAPSRQWPVAQLAACLDEVATAHPDWGLALIGGRGADQQTAKETLAAMRQPGRVVDLVAAVDLKQTGALLARADALVTMDTGPMHIAAAVGTPLVGLFGATAVDRTGPTPPPPGSRGVLPLALVHREGLDCVPCEQRECRRGDLACLARQSPAVVRAAVERQLAAGRRAG